MVENIEETTVGMLGDIRVAMANMVFEGSYERADGSTAAGLACVLVPLDGSDAKYWVGLDSRVTIGGAHWQVTGISKPRHGNGSISLRSVDIQDLERGMSQNR